MKVRRTADISFLPYKKVKCFLRHCVLLIYQAVVWPVDTSPPHRERCQWERWKSLAPLVGIRATKQHFSSSLWAPGFIKDTKPSDSSCPPKHRLLLCRQPRQTPVAALFPVHRVCSWTPTAISSAATHCELPTSTVSHVTEEIQAWFLIRNFWMSLFIKQAPHLKVKRCRASGFRDFELKDSAILGQ